MFYLLVAHVQASKTLDNAVRKLQPTNNSCAGIKHKVSRPSLPMAPAEAASTISEDYFEQKTLAQRAALIEARKKLSELLARKKAKAKLLSLQIAKQKNNNPPEIDAYTPVGGNIIYAGNLVMTTISKNNSDKAIKLAANKNFIVKKNAASKRKTSPLIITMKNIFSIKQAKNTKEDSIKNTKTDMIPLVSKSSGLQNKELTLLEEGLIALAYANATQYFLEGKLQKALDETNKILAIDQDNPDGLILLYKIEKNMH
jgi:hypothetical protein